MEAAEAIARTCRIVFVTAYDAYAVEAFEKEAVDYLLKPVAKDRLRKTVQRIKAQLAKGSAPAQQMADLIGKILDRPGPPAVPGYLQWIRVQHEDGIRFIAVDDVLYFRAGDKYTAVRTGDGEWLIRKSIRTLSEELDPAMFWQVHRSTIVNVSKVAGVSRSLTGRGIIKLKETADTLTVSRGYLHLFKQM